MNAPRAPSLSPHALEWFARFGVAVERVMTDNGSAYVSRAFGELLKNNSIRHKRTRPCTPRTNGKAERFIQTSLREWAYANAYQTSNERTDALSPWIARYNSQRHHSGIGHRTPFNRLNNLLGFDNETRSRMTAVDSRIAVRHQV